MKKTNLNPDLFKIFREKYKITGNDRIKTTNINILLNRVRKNKKIEFTKRIIFSLLLLLFTSFVAVFFLFQ